MVYRIIGLNPAPFAPLFGRSAAALAAVGVERVRVETTPGAPCRIALDDAPVGADVLLLNYEHQPHDTPYRARHAIFVTEGATEAWESIDVLPPALARRTLSLRAFDARHRMIDADLADGPETIEAVIARMLAGPEAAYLQAHYARRGCYAARVERA